MKTKELNKLLNVMTTGVMKGTVEEKSAKSLEKILRKLNDDIEEIKSKIPVMMK